jgi:hypothetical protein
MFTIPPFAQIVTFFCFCKYPEVTHADASGCDKNMICSERTVEVRQWNTRRCGSRSAFQAKDDGIRIGHDHKETRLGLLHG